MAGVEKAIGNQSLSLAGKTGAVISIGADAITVELDQSVDLLEDWDNRAIWTMDEIPNYSALEKEWDKIDDQAEGYALHERRFFMMGYLASLCEVISVADEESDEAERLKRIPSVESLVSVGLFHEDIDAACYAVQTALGVTDGGLAGEMMTGDDWRADFRGYVERERRGVISDLQEKTR